MSEEDTTITYPEGDYAIVEVMGHVRHVGRVSEVERFGQKFCQVEPLKNHEFLPPVLVGGASIYQFRPCSAEQAFMLTETWEFKDAHRALPAPAMEEDEDDIPFEEGDAA